MEASVTKLGIYLSKHRHANFKLGVFDCCMFVVHWIDFYSNKNTSKTFINTYNNEKQLASAFAKANVNEYLAQNGYGVTSDTPKNLDIILNAEADHSSAWLVLNNKAYTMTSRGLIRTGLSRLGQTTVWRLK